MAGELLGKLVKRQIEGNDGTSGTMGHKGEFDCSIGLRTEYGRHRKRSGQPVRGRRQLGNESRKFR